MDSFSDRLTKALEARHMTASDLSKRTGIGEGTLSNYKKGRYEPKQRILNKIAEALDVSISYLMGADVQLGRYELTQNVIHEKSQDNAYVLDEIEKFILDTYRKADARQKMRIGGLISEIADEIEKNHSGTNGNGKVG